MSADFLSAQLRNIPCTKAQCKFVEKKKTHRLFPYLLTAQHNVCDEGLIKKDAVVDE